MKQLKSYETSEVMCHVGYIDKYLVEGSSFTLPHLYQTDFMIHSEFAKAIQNDKDIQLVHYDDIDF